MFSKVSVSVVVLTLLCNAAFAVIPTCPPDFKLQYQDFTIGALNVVTLGGAGGQASCNNFTAIFQDQHDKKICSWASQQEVVLFNQLGTAVGTCGGLWNVTQAAFVGGGQLQLVADGCGPKMESQTLGVDLFQVVTKIDGTGSAIASHDLGVVQTQNAGNSAGMMGQVNAVAAGQHSSVSGGPSTSGQVTSGLIVGTTQAQFDL